MLLNVVFVTCLLEFGLVLSGLFSSFDMMKSRKENGQLDNCKVGSREMKRSAPCKIVTPMTWFPNEGAIVHYIKFS